MSSSELLQEPMTYLQVNEGEYAVAYPDNQTHLVTLRVNTCKAVTLHDPITKRGALAHLDGTTKPDKVLGTVIEAYGTDLSSVDVQIAQATIDNDEILWPSIDTIAGIFMQFNPRSLILDRNDGRGVIRDFALNLSSGKLLDIDRNSIAFTNSKAVEHRATPLRRSVFRYL